VNEAATHYDTEGILRLIAETTAYSTGEEFLRQLVRTVTQALNVRIAFVAEFINNNTVARILACWDGESFDEPREYELAETPCETVLDGEIHCFPDRVIDLFPKERDLEPLGIRSYLAIPLLSHDGEVMGHLAILDDKPMKSEPRDIDVFRIFGARACAELQRKRFEDVLKQSEERLSRILASAMDAIIAIDQERRIVLFNHAAERIFACSAGWAIGQPFDRFLSRPFRSLLDEYFRGADGPRQVWTPAGLTAVRANREEFPIEASISPLTAGGQLLYTIILRDVNERMKTQAELARLRQQNIYLQSEIEGEHKFEDMVGESAVMKELFAAIRSVAHVDATVLINGETGTGKELIARALHNLSGRKDKLFVKMNCAALPSELIESELFGHEKGAFTGATAQRKGRFEVADGGTLFLDEVGELSAPAQAKLLRVLQEQEFERVGGSRTLRVDVRIIAATNRNLADAVQAGAFRSDLYYRLNVFPLLLPPLRERAEDIPLLAAHFLERSMRRLGKSFKGIEPESMNRLRRYHWPGNIRELQNIIERAAILSAGETLVIQESLAPPAGGVAPGAVDLRTLEQIEDAHIRQVLQQTEWVIEGKRGAAIILGLEPSTLRYRMQKLGIKRPTPG